MPVQSDSLIDLIEFYKAEYNLNEYELYRLIDTGFHGFFKYRLKGMPNEVMTYLLRASQREKSWVLNGQLIPMEEWLGRYQSWKF